MFTPESADKRGRRGVSDHWPILAGPMPLAFTSMDAIRDCGWAGLFMLLLTGVGTLLGVVGAVLGFVRRTTGAKIVGGIVLAIGLADVALGPAGQAAERAQIDSATSGESVSPAQRDRIRKVGYEEAGRCIEAGFETCVLPILFGALSLGLGISRAKRPLAA
jgi:hypothetical protein